MHYAGLLNGPVLGHAGPGQVEPQGREQGHPGRRYAGVQFQSPPTPPALPLHPKLC